MQIRTLSQINDPRGGGVRIAANVKLDLPKAAAEKLIAEGKAEKTAKTAKTDKDK